MPSPQTLPSSPLPSSTCYGDALNSELPYYCIISISKLLRLPLCCRFPVMMFPNQITNIINGSVAIKRIQKYIQVRPRLWKHCLVPMNT